MLRYRQKNIGPKHDERSGKDPNRLAFDLTLEADKTPAENTTPHRTP